MQKNIKLAYLLTFFRFSWFWLGIWIFYYLRFTNYAGIGLIETVMIAIMTLAEIPTGAIADIFGKKNTIFFSFIFFTIGIFLMGIAPNFSALLISIILLAVGSSLYSGTIESLVYDSLKQDNNESFYPKVIAKIHSIQLLTPALCGAIGGILYKYNPQLPFIINSFFHLAGLIISLFVIEPIIDSVKFSFKNYLFQTKQGIRELFKTQNIKRQTILLLSIGFIVIIVDQMLNIILGVEYGMKEQYIGIIWAIIYLVSALSLQIIPTISKKINENIALIIIGFLIAITLIISPVLGLFIGTISIIFRSSFQSIYFSLASIAINKNTESKYRATTLSTFNMINNIPYVCTAFFIGSLADKFSAKTLSLYSGIILMTLLFFQFKKIKFIANQKSLSKI
jgi:MFS family permease